MQRFVKTIFSLMMVGILLVACGAGEEEDVSEGTTTNEDDQVEEVADESRADEEDIQLAESFIEEVSTEQYESAVSKFDETMAEQVGAEELQELWESLEEQLGEFIDYEYYRTEPVDGYQVILINGIFNDIDAVFQVTVDENQEIAGFYIQ